MDTTISHLARPRISPYLIIIFTGLLAFLPVSSMLFAVKNDLLGIEYPINYFISESLRHGQFPAWFNTWDMGFPLSSCLSWGIYSTPQLLFSGLFPYSIWILQVELLFFIVLCGITMYYLLKRHVVTDQRIALYLAIAYMLSGFVVSATQWMPYLTAAAFIPLLISAALDLFKTPGWFSDTRFAFVYLLLLTSSYPAFVVVASYGLALLLLFMLLRSREKRSFILRHLFITFLFTALLCLPVLLATLEVLQHLVRGKPMDSTSSFFTANYFHPRGLETLLLPFAAVKLTAPNTEATMLHLYMGLGCLLLLPVALRESWKRKFLGRWLLPIAALFFLLVSLGHLLPLRSVMNLLPGFSYFRHAGNFRFFTILLFILYIGYATRPYRIEELLTPATIAGKWVYRTAQILLVGVTVVAVGGFFYSTNIISHPIGEYVRSLSGATAVTLSAICQFLVLLFLMILLAKRKIWWARMVLVGELVLNTLICTPFFTVSSYSPLQIDRMLARTPGFPVQYEAPSEVPATYTDDRPNTFVNINVFTKKISSNPTYVGGLYLERGIADSIHTRTSLAFAWPDDEAADVAIEKMLPSAIQLDVEAKNATLVRFDQNYFPGWTAYYNGKVVPIERNVGGLAANVPPGHGLLEFRFQRPDLLISSLALNSLMVCFGVLIFARRWKRRLPRN